MNIDGVEVPEGIKEKLEQYESSLHPTSIVSLIDEEILRLFLTGCSVELQSGIALYFAKVGNPELVDIRCVEVSSENRQRGSFYHPFCETYRSEPDQDEACKAWDEEIALRYYRGAWKGPKLYRCHMQMWDMAYPIEIDGLLLGVLFGGQMYAGSESPCSSESFESIRSEVECGNSEFHQNQREAILREIDNLKETDGALSEGLRETLKNLPNDQILTFESLINRYENFKELAKSIQKLARKQYDLTVMRCRGELITDLETVLTSNLASVKKWWKAAAYISERFRQIVDSGPVEIYTRRRSRYIQGVGPLGANDPDKAKKIPVNVTIAVPERTIITNETISRDSADFVATLGLKNQRFSLLRYDTHSFEEWKVSTLVIVRDLPPSEMASNVFERFARMIGLRANIGTILFEAVEERLDFMERARRVSHHTKHPLQIALIHRENTQRLLNHNECSMNHSVLTMINKELNQMNLQMQLAKREMAELYSRAEYPREELEIAKILREIVDSCEPQGKAKGCSLESSRITDRVPIVRMYEPELRIALTNIVDNAIKYSFRDQTIFVACEKQKQEVVITVSNKGYGIPPEHLEDVFKAGFRVHSIKSSPDDPEGTGMGLNIVSDIVERYRGSINIDSHPVTGTNHWKTTVVVILPTK